MNLGCLALAPEFVLLNTKLQFRVIFVLGEREVARIRPEGDIKDNPEQP